MPTAGLLSQWNVQLLGNAWDAQDHLKRASNPSDAGPHKAFPIRPGKFAENYLTVLAPFVLEGGKAPRLSLQIGMLLRSGESENFFGYRFECPELPGEEHKYFHAQPLQRIGHGQALAMSVVWYPNRYPTFPLAAENALELVIALLASVREWQRIADLRASNSNVSRETRQAVDRFIRKIRPEPAIAADPA